MRRTGVLLALALAFAAGSVRADMYKCYLPGASVLYTNDKRDTYGKKCEVVSREISVIPAQGASKSGGKISTPKEFPRENASQRASAKDRQQEILEKELHSEEALLEKAKKALAEQEAVRSGNEKNYARVLERLKPYQDDVDVHQKNIDALKREIANLYK